MKKETKEPLRIFGAAIVMMMVVPIAYRVFVHFCPPEEKPRQTLAQFLEEVQRESCMKLLTKPIAKWSDAEAKLEPEVYVWLKEQGNEILPWEWTEEARRKDMPSAGIAYGRNGRFVAKVCLRSIGRR